MISSIYFCYNKVHADIVLTNPNRFWKDIAYISLQIVHELATQKLTLFTITDSDPIFLEFLTESEINSKQQENAIENITC